MSRQLAWQIAPVVVATLTACDGEGRGLFEKHIDVNEPVEVSIETSQVEAIEATGTVLVRFDTGLGTYAEVPPHLEWQLADGMQVTTVDGIAIADQSTTVKHVPYEEERGKKRLTSKAYRIEARLNLVRTTHSSEALVRSMRVTFPRAREVCRYFGCMVSIPSLTINVAWYPDDRTRAVQRFGSDIAGLLICIGIACVGVWLADRRMSIGVVAIGGAIAVVVFVGLLIRDIAWILISPEGIAVAALSLAVHSGESVALWALYRRRRTTIRRVWQLSAVATMIAVVACLIYGRFSTAFFSATTPDVEWSLWHVSILLCLLGVAAAFASLRQRGGYLLVGRRAIPLDLRWARALGRVQKPALISLGTAIVVIAVLYLVRSSASGENGGAAQADRGWGQLVYSGVAFLTAGQGALIAAAVVGTLLLLLRRLLAWKACERCRRCDVRIRIDLASARWVRCPGCGTGHVSMLSPQLLRVVRHGIVLGSFVALRGAAVRRFTRRHPRTYAR